MGKTLPASAQSGLIGRDGAPRRGTADHPTVVVVFASWCGPCRSEFPATLEVPGHPPPGQGVGAGGGRAGHAAPKANAFLQQNHVSMTSISDPQATRGYGRSCCRVIPDTIFVSAEGVVQSMTSGPSPPRSSRRASRRLERLVEAKVRAASSGAARPRHQVTTSRWR